jgi:hypothetical protein
LEEASVIESANITTNCSSTGWDVSIANTGQTKWKGPLKFVATIDHMDGITETEDVQTWEGDDLELDPLETWEAPVNPGANGKLTLSIKRGNNIIWSDSQVCVPQLQITAGCSEQGVVYEVQLNGNTKMIDPLNFTIRPTDGSDGIGQGSIKLPTADNSTVVQVRTTEVATSGDIPVYGPLQFEFAVPVGHWMYGKSLLLKDCDQPECCEGDEWCVLGPNPSSAESNTTILTDGAFYYENEYLCPSDESKMAISYQYLRENVQFCWPQVETRSLPKHLHIYSVDDPMTDGEGKIENHLAYIVADEALIGQTCYLTVNVGEATQACYEFVATSADHINISSMTLVSG